MFSVDCFIHNNGISIPPPFYKMILACIFPLICIGSVSIFWALIWYLKKNSKAWTKLGSSVIILIFITLPILTTITFSIYNCVDALNDGHTYLALDMSLQCWTGDHYKYAVAIGVPVIIIWIIALPLLALYLLFRKRKELGNEDNISKYGFMYTGLNYNSFYWEILLHFRKVIMISINVYLITFKPLYRVRLVRL